MAGVSQSPGRYQTSMAGMVGAMIVLVGCILAFVAFREVNREVPEVKPEAIDWQTAVTAAADNGHPVVAPAKLPADWIATSIDFKPTDPPTFGLGMLTDKGKYVGLRQEDERRADLIEMYVDDEAVEGEPVEVGGEFAGAWDTWTDEGGDTALLLQREDDVLLVYGSAPEEDLVEFASSLRTAQPRESVSDEADASAG